MLNSTIIIQIKYQIDKENTINVNYYLFYSTVLYNSNIQYDNDF